MRCEDRLIEQVHMTKAANPATRVFVYRNLVKALPWFETVQAKISDPAYAGWFLPFGPPTVGDHWTVPNCDKNYDPPLCSTYYHDQDQTPQHPHGDGSCTLPCDCGGVPCGEYLFDHRNASLRQFLVEEFILGANGLANANVSGFYLDDGWANTSQPVLPWMPQPMGFCDHSPIGGATEEDYNCARDMGLKQADTTAITDAWRLTLAAVQEAIISHGAFSWAYFRQLTIPGPGNASACASWFRETGSTLTGYAYVQQFYNATQRPLPAVSQDIAAFLVLRGDFAWLGYGWIGCTTDYEYPPALEVDYGVPLTPYFNETSPGVFTREWSKATATFSCPAWTGTVTMK